MTVQPLRPVRNVFISDPHLGTPGCEAEALLAFLKQHSSDYLYLVGDIVDGWHAVVRGHIHRAEIRVIDSVLYCNDGDWVEICTTQAARTSVSPLIPVAARA